MGFPLRYRGKIFCSCNAGAVRILLPTAFREVVAEMRTARHCVLSRGPWPALRLPDAVDIMFDDGSASPYALHLSPESFNLLPAMPPTEPTPVYLIVGCPGSGKSWICSQLAEQFSYIAHDDFIGQGRNKYPEAIIRAARTSTRPVLCETPFSVSLLLDPLTKADCRVVPLFILEKFEVIATRYRDREGVEIPLGHLNRQNTYRSRAILLGAFRGTSAEVLDHLRMIASRQAEPVGPSGTAGYVAECIGKMVV